MIHTIILIVLIYVALKVVRQTLRDMRKNADERAFERGLVYRTPAARESGSTNTPGDHTDSHLWI